MNSSPDAASPVPPQQVLYDEYGRPYILVLTKVKVKRGKKPKEEQLFDRVENKLVENLPEQIGLHSDSYKEDEQPRRVSQIVINKRSTESEDEPLRFIYVHRNSLSLLPNEDEFMCKVLSQQKMNQSLSREQRIEIIKKKPRNFNWEKCGSLVTMQEQPCKIECCNRLPRCKHASPRQSLVTEKLYNTQPYEQSGGLFDVKYGKVSENNITDLAFKETVPETDRKAISAFTCELLESSPDQGQDKCFTIVEVVEKTPIRPRRLSQPRRSSAGSWSSSPIEDFKIMSSSKDNCKTEAWNPCNESKTRNSRIYEHRSQESRTDSSIAQGIWDQLTDVDPTENLYRKPSRKEQQIDPEVIGPEVIHVTSSGMFSEGSLFKAKSTTSSGSYTKEGSMQKPTNDESHINDQASAIVANLLRNAQRQVGKENSKTTTKNSKSDDSMPL